ncbi:ATP-dependent DNA helicase RecG [Candidatus Gottesmanbacteria bacterium]|nr:ATP-dependent DNA helicase RecG [Candidatus Gottesmanbacteria bacterium]
MELRLDSPVQYVSRVGPGRAKLLDTLGIRSVEDLLYYVPFRYDDFSLVSPIARVQPGETVTIAGTIQSIVNLLTKTGKRMQQAVVADDTGKLTVTWFNQPFLLRVLPKGTAVRLAGQVTWFGNKIVMSSPNYELTQQAQSLHTGRLVPIYSETAGITSKWLRGRIADILDNVSPQLEEYLPETTKKTYGLMDLPKAIAHVHFPSSNKEAEEAKRRLAFDELLLLQARAHLLRQNWQAQKHSYPITIPRDGIQRFIASLPFELTDDQKNSLKEIFDDLGKSSPMNRLLVGDVGSGKTVVAAIAMYAAFGNGLQSVLMAPTEILALQHYETISNFLAPLGINVGITTGSRKSQITNPNDQWNVIVGTHALLFESVKFDKLGLVVIDEQHRFGVEQRAKLSEKNTNDKTPHLLTMTATPIPRTVARIIFGNLDLSILNQMPKGRIKVKTWVVPNNKRTAAYEWITKQVTDTGGQAFVICPLIDESETLASVKAVTTEYKRLQATFPQFSLGLLHGRLTAKEKTGVLEAFRKGTHQILVTTPVVEVGIDIPNATIMMIEAADRFGLGQLHQLRGRVGRGALQSYCLLFTEAQDENAISRLKNLETIFSGPELAEVDLKLRGPGQLFGTRQHGVPELHIAQFSDSQLIKQTQEALKSLITFPPLRAKAQKGTIQSAVAD